jgi:hypothetical protein
VFQSPRLFSIGIFDSHEDQRVGEGEVQELVGARDFQSRVTNAYTIVTESPVPEIRRVER